jgi:sulfite exporter TauE/SafE
MSLAAWLSVLAASLLGSVHCAAMCGGFVAAYAGAEARGAGGRAAAHAAYNGGRLLTYLGLGAVAGALGHALDLAGRAAGVAHVAGIVTGVLLLVSGALGLSARSELVRLKRGPGGSLTRGLGKGLGALLASFREKPAPVRAAVLGLSSTLLPCGWLYAFAAFAAGSGSASAGAFLMSAFWLGSLPVMLGVGLSLQGLSSRFKRELPRLRSLLVLGVGAFTLLTRLQMPAFAAGAAHGHAAGLSPEGPPMSADCPLHRKASVR